MNNLNETKSLHALKYMFAAYQNKLAGKLTGLTAIYEIHGSPPGISPFDVFDNPVNRFVTDAYQAMYPDDNIIEYRNKDILVNHILIETYVQMLDNGTRSEEAVWLKILALCKEKHDHHLEADKILYEFYDDFKHPDIYYNLPF